MKLWCRGEEILINLTFDSTHKESIKINRETITPIVDTRRLFVCQNTSLIGQKDCTKINQEVGKSGLSNSADLVEML